MFEVSPRASNSCFCCSLILFFPFCISSNNAFAFCILFAIPFSSANVVVNPATSPALPACLTESANCSIFCFASSALIPAIINFSINIPIPNKATPITVVANAVLIIPERSLILTPVSAAVRPNPYVAALNEPSVLIPRNCDAVNATKAGTAASKFLINGISALRLRAWIAMVRGSTAK